uniref:Uncharacterized protein n=1 Tax=Anguilla anguilla TaxID=7936 RepID=A0A0E9TY97_ANGAN
MILVSVHWFLILGDSPHSTGVMVCSIT